MNLFDATHELFNGVIGDSFSIEAEGVNAIELISVEVKPSHEDAKRTPFVLTFHGPVEAVLPQSIYVLEHQKLGQLEIFLVPVDKDKSHVHYEAVFN
ncbi:MAG: hypothetical protein O7F71_01860 [Gammaproteobacteria bacterium]|nr:hypothetical protein [Gammaproteobacteria bacterium]